MIVKGYALIARLVRVEGTDSQPVTLAQELAPIPIEVWQKHEYQRKGIANQLIFNILSNASSAEKGSPPVGQLVDKPNDYAASLLHELAAFIRDNKVSGVRVAQSTLGKTNVCVIEYRKDS